MKINSSYYEAEYLKEAASFLVNHSALIEHEIILIGEKINEVHSQCDFLRLDSQDEEHIDLGALYCVLEQIERIAGHWNKAVEDICEDIYNNQPLTPPTNIRKLKPFD